MGNGLGLILGGALEGVGAGIVQDVQTKREQALADLRAQREAQNITLKAGYDAKNAEATDERKYKQSMGLLAAGAKFDKDKIVTQGTVEANVITPAKTAGKVAEIGAQGAADQVLQAQKDNAELARDSAVQQLRNSGSQADIRLAENLKGPVQSSYTNADGKLVIVKKDGSVVTTRTKGAAPKGGEDDPIGARGGAPSPSPASPTPTATAAARPAPSTKAATGTPLDRAYLTNLYTQATTRSVKGDPRYRGLSASQIKAKVDDGLRNKGYAIP